MNETLEEEFRKNVGMSFRTLRVNLGYTQKFVAKIGGVTQSSISNFERGHDGGYKVILSYLKVYPKLLKMIERVENDSQRS